MFDENPNKKPCGLVVVKPTRIFSAIVERQLPKKSYLTEELERKLTPISGERKKKHQFCWKETQEIITNMDAHIGEKKQTISTDWSFECTPTAITCIAVISFVACSIVKTWARVTSTNTIGWNTVQAASSVWFQIGVLSVQQQSSNTANEAIAIVDRCTDHHFGSQV